MRAASILPVALLAAALLAPLAPATPAAGGAGGSPDDFRVTLRLEAPGGVRDQVAFGVSPTASAGYDAGLDKPEPPAPPIDTFVQAYVHHADAASPNLRKLNVSILPAADAVSWTLKLDVRGPGGTLRLLWDPVEARIAGAARNVTLTSDGQTLDLKSGGVLELTIPPGALSKSVTARLEPAALPVGSATNQTAGGAAGNATSAGTGSGTNATSSGVPGGNATNGTRSPTGNATAGGNATRGGATGNATRNDTAGSGPIRNATGGPLDASSRNDSTPIGRATTTPSGSRVPAPGVFLVVAAAVSLGLILRRRG